MTKTSTLELSRAARRPAWVRARAAAMAVAVTAQPPHRAPPLRVRGGGGGGVCGRARRSAARLAAAAVPAGVEGEEAGEGAGGRARAARRRARGRAQREASVVVVPSRRARRGGGGGGEHNKEQHRREQHEGGSRLGAVRTLLSRREVDEALALMVAHVDHAGASRGVSGGAAARRAVRAHSWDFAQAAARAGRGDAAAAYARLVGADVRFFTEAVGAFGRARDARGLAALVREMDASGVQPDQRLYRGLVAAYGRAGQLDKARGVFEQAQAAASGMVREPAATPLWNALADACGRCGRLDEALTLLQRMQGGEGAPPDAVTYNTLIAAAAKARRPKLVRTLWGQMHSERSAGGSNGDDGALVPDARTLSALMSAAANTADAVWAARLYEELQPFMRSDEDKGQQAGQAGVKAARRRQRDRSRGTGATRAASVSSLLTAVARGLQQGLPTDRRRWRTRVVGGRDAEVSRDPAALADAWRRARGAYDDLLGCDSEHVGQSVFSAYMAAAVAAGEPLAALSAADDMRARGVEHNTYTVAGMLRACGMLRGEAIDGSGGEMVVVQGQLLRHEEDSAAFATRIFDSIFPSGSMSAAADSDDALGDDDVEDGFDVSLAAAVSLDDDEALFVCNAHAKCLLDLGQRPAAFDLLSRMRQGEHGLPLPDLVTYNTFLSALRSECRGGNGFIAWSLVCNMREEEIVPDRATALSMVSACAQGGDAHTVEDAFAELRSAGYVPDTSGWNALLAAMLKATPDGDDDASRRVLEVLPEAMRAEGVEPDVITFGTLLNAARRLRDVEAAAGLYDQMASRQIVPSPECHDTFAQTAAAAGHVEEALSVVKRALRRQPTKVADATLESLVVSICQACPEEVLVAARLLHLLRSRGGVVATATQAALVGAAARQGHVQLALELFAAIEGETLPPEARDGLVGALCSAGMAEKAWGIVEVDAGLETLTDATLMQLITASLRGGSGRASLTRALSFYRCLRGRGMERLRDLPRRGGPMWASLIEGCVAAAELDSALRVFDQMRAVEATASRAVLAYLSSACMRDVLHRQRALDVAAQIRQQQLYDDDGNLRPRKATRARSPRGDWRTGAAHGPPSAWDPIEPQDWAEGPLS